MAVYLDWGTPAALPLHRVTPQQLRRYRFAEGSMAPKVEALCRFVEATGGIGGIGRLEDAAAILAGTAGTIVCRNECNQRCDHRVDSRVDSGAHLKSLVS
jgi:carbamate kinase